MEHRARGIMVALIVLCLSVTAYAEEKFPWLMTMYKHTSLTPEQKRIYLNSYFESMFFILYNYTPSNDKEAIRQVNAWIDCVNETKQVETWTPDLSWTFAEDMDKSAAYVLYNKASPLICKEFEKRAGTSSRVLRIYSFEDWEKWSLKDKAVYLAGYLDTMAAFQMRLKEHGVQNDLRELQIVIEATGIDGILSETVNIKTEKKAPLPWTMSSGLGAARKKMMKQ